MNPFAAQLAEERRQQLLADAPRYRQSRIARPARPAERTRRVLSHRVAAGAGLGRSGPAVTRALPCPPRPSSRAVWSISGSEINHTAREDDVSDAGNPAKPPARTGSR